MKQTPYWSSVRRAMEPGRITRDGMLGEDRRPPEEIVAADDATARRLGLSHERIAQRMSALTEAARERLGDTALLEGVYEVSVDESRGGIPCPFGHCGRFPKSVTRLKHLPSGEELLWTPLGIHMIEAHGFYEGVGAPFRNGPDRLARILQILPEEASADVRD